MVERHTMRVYQVWYKGFDDRPFIGRSDLRFEEVMPIISTWAAYTLLERYPTREELNSFPEQITKIIIHDLAVSEFSQYQIIDFGGFHTPYCFNKLYCQECHDELKPKEDFNAFGIPMTKCPNCGILNFYISNPSPDGDDFIEYLTESEFETLIGKEE